MTMPKISIITPSFNQGCFIEETILSVLEQGYPNLEYIIIDGGSNDNTIEIIRKYSKYIAYWVSEKDTGQSNAINKGMRLVTGTIVNWLNSDDYYMPKILHHVASIFNDQAVNCYCGRSRIFSETKEYISQGTDIYKNNLSKSIGWARIDQPETFFRKEAWDTIGLLNEKFHYVMDKEWWVRYLLNFGLNSVVKDDKVLVNFRIHNQSKTSSQAEKFRQETFDLFYSIAESKSLPIASALSNLERVHSKEIFGYQGTNRALIEESVHYFLLLLSLESYAGNQYNQAKRVASFIEMAHLKQEDIRALRSVLLRMKLLPVGAKKLINKLKGRRLFSSF